MNAPGKIESERDQWNAKGLCARGACPNSHDGCLNGGNGLLYCVTCARLINEHTPGLVAIDLDAARALRRDRRA